MSTTLYEIPINSHWDISQNRWKRWPAGGSRTKLEDRQSRFRVSFLRTSKGRGATVSITSSRCWGILQVYSDNFWLPSVQQKHIFYFLQNTTDIPTKKRKPKTKQTKKKKKKPGAKLKTLQFQCEFLVCLLNGLVNSTGSGVSSHSLNAILHPEGLRGSQRGKCYLKTAKNWHASPSPHPKYSIISRERAF